MKKIIILFFITLIYSAIHAQAPGGVSTGLQIWLKADQGVTLAGTSVTAMANQASGGGSLGTTGTAPTFVANGVNFNPAIQLNGTGCMQGNLTAHTTWNLGHALSVYTVSRRTATGSTSLFFTMAPATLSEDEAGTSYSLSGRPNELSSTLMRSNGFSDRYFSNSSLSGIFDIAGGFMNPYNAEHGTSTVTLNGSVATINGLNTSLTWRYGAGRDRVIFGGRVDYSTNNTLFYTGFGTETIVYNQTLTAQEQLRINSYLAIKYGKTLDQSSPLNYLASNASVLWNATTNTTYSNNIAGIARDDASALYQKQSNSINTGFQPIISLDNLATSNQTNPSVISTDRSALLWGSNTATTTFDTDYAFGVMNRHMNRIWKVQETGTIGVVKVYADASIFPVNAIYPHLLVSNSATFDGSTTNITMSEITINGTKYYVADVDLVNGQFYTFGALLTAPGGVLSGIQLWVKSNKGVNLGVGFNVTSYINHATQNGLLSKDGATLTLEENVLNFNPALRFAGSKLENTSSLLSFTDTDGYDIFDIAKRNTPGGGTAMSFTIGGPSITIANTITSVTTTTAKGFGGIDNIRSWTTGEQNGYTLTNMSLNNFNAQTTSLTASEFGEHVASFNQQGSALNTWDGTRTVTLLGGRRNGTGGTVYCNVDIPELVVYNTNNDLVNKLKVNSYLSIKYGFTMGSNTSPINYLMSDGSQIWTSDNTYQNNIAGIIRDDASALWQKQSRSQMNGLQPVISNGTLATTNQNNTSTFTNDKTALVWGSDAGALTFSEPFVAGFATGIFSNRMERIWKVQETNALGAVNVYILKNELPLTAVGYYLLVSNDAVFDDSDMILQMNEVTINGEDFYTVSVDFVNGQYFTFATPCFNGTYVIPINTLFTTNLSSYCTLNDWIYYHNSDYRAVIAIRPNGSTWNPDAININTQAFLNTQTDGINSSVVLQRLWQIVHTTALTNPVDVRMYYDPNELITQVPIGSYPTQGWFKHSGDFSDVESDLIPEALLRTNAVELTPTEYGTEMGVDYIQFNGIASFSTIGYTGNTSTTVLPITLTSFIATNVENKHIRLDWITASESNNNYFVVERSIDGINWSLVGQVSGAGNSAVQNIYMLEDHSPYNSISYYRLKQIDYDGSYSYSDIKSVSFDTSDQDNLFIYPNPTNNAVILESTLKPIGEFELVNPQGQNLTKMIVFDKLTENKYIIDLSKLQNGIYFIKTDNKMIGIVKQE